MKVGGASRGIAGDRVQMGVQEEAISIRKRREKVQGLVSGKMVLTTVQSIVALFITEVEYMAVAETAKEALWLTGLVKERGIEQGGVQLHCDS